MPRIFNSLATPFVRLGSLLRPRGAARVWPPRRAAAVTRLRQRPGVWLFSLVALVATVTIASIPPRDALEPRPPTDMPLTPPTQIVEVPDLNGALTRTVIPGAPVQGTRHALAEALTDKLVRVRRGDTLAGILEGLGLNHAEVQQLIGAHPEAKSMYRLRAGQELRVAVGVDGSLRRLDFPLSENESLRFERGAAGFEGFKDVRRYDSRYAYVAGGIESSLFLDGQAAGLSDTLIMQMVDIFGWDIDFAQDLRAGDSFAVIYEEKVVQGEKVADGNIVTAEFINQGKVYRAMAHRDDKGGLQFYSADGMSLRRAFLRSPVKFSRITSRFSSGRFHPILKTWRAHTGVDYGAPTGTPVMATASGRVIHVGAKGGYGNTVILKHGGSYSTLYAHLSRYHSGVRVGSYVDQGDVVGYVGNTGLATGPHLHYEFQVNGSHRNPLTYQFPQAEPIAAEYKKEFLEAARIWSARLDAVSRRTLAMAPEE